MASTPAKSIPENVPVILGLAPGTDLWSVATVLAAAFVRSGSLPDCMGNGEAVALKGKGVLVIGLGKTVTAVEVLPGQAEPE